ncbi:MAG TPA: heme-binding protein [Candidatus Baltobacteraceae bacterium]|nr:heme-binding protein [Candidatus Baltobacteraceae bacterium]
MPRPSLASSIAVLLFASALICGCGGGGSGSSSSGGSGGTTQYPQPPAGFAFLTQSDVMTVVQTAAATANSSTMAIAVTDRLGNILAVWEGASMPATSTGNFGQAVPTGELAVNLARTASFFSNDQAPLSSRTVRYISGIHFPPGIANTPNAALYGIENTNRGCSLSPNYLPGQAIPPATTISGSPSRLGVITGKADVDDSDPNAVNPGGVPIFKAGHIVGGVGIAGVPLDVAEFVAYTAAGLIGVPSASADGIGFQPLPAPGEVVIDGIALPFVDNTTAPGDLTPATGSFDATRYVSGPITDPIAGPTPEGYLVAATNGPLGGLSASAVNSIIMNAVSTADQTRALIRLPPGARARMAIAVSDLDGTIIGMYRMHDATVFSIDVAASKARNVIYFSGPNRTPADLPGVPMGTAVTNRTIGFGAQPLYPPGINGSSPGPFFSLYTQDVANPCTQGADPPGPPGPNPNQSGIVFFPGSEPLYVNGVLVGGLGVSGDGVDQDDYVTSGGAAGYEAPANIRADQIVDDGVRLPFLHFPRNPTD